MTDHPIMTAQDLIDELEAVVANYGDCIVTMNGNDHETISEVRCYDADGMFKGPIVEFSLISN